MSKYSQQPDYNTNKEIILFEKNMDNQNNTNNQSSCLNEEESTTSLLVNYKKQSTMIADCRPFDVIIFGASSSVGNFLIEELALVTEKYFNDNNHQQEQTITNTSSIKEFRDPSIQFAQHQNKSNKRLSVPRHMNERFKWAIAGRSAIRLQESLCKAELSTGIKGLSNNIPVVLADLQQHKSLIDMCSKTKLIFNCAGPYSIDGEALIKACINCKTNYLDLSHETKFIDKIRKKYHNQAKQAGIYIINGCGFQSMSAEMGLNFIKQVVDGQIDDVKIILNLSDTSAIIKPNSNHVKSKSLGLISWGMWNSYMIDKSQVEDQVQYSKEHNAINQLVSSNTIENNHEAQSCCNQENEKQMQESCKKQLLRKDTQTLVRDLIELKNKKQFNFFELIKGFIDSPSNGYCLPINNLSSEQAQLIRGEMTSYQERNLDLIDIDKDSKDYWKPIRSRSFITMKNLTQTIFALIWLIIFNILIEFSYLRRIMRIFPTIISLGNVTNNKNSRLLDRDSLNHIKFSQTFLVYGTPGADSGDPLEHRDKHIKRKQEQLLVARIVGPEPNHIATASFAIQACLAVILEKDHLPTCGGVLTPGSAFAETNIIYQLRRRNIKFEVLKKA